MEVNPVSEEKLSARMLRNNLSKTSLINQVRLVTQNEKKVQRSDRSAQEAQYKQNHAEVVHGSSAFFRDVGDHDLLDSSEEQKAANRLNDGKELMRKAVLRSRIGAEYFLEQVQPILDREEHPKDLLMLDGDKSIQGEDRLAIEEELKIAKQSLKKCIDSTDKAGSKVFYFILSGLSEKIKFSTIRTIGKKITNKTPSNSKELLFIQNLYLVGEGKFEQYHNKLSLHNQRLVAHVARDYKGCGLDYEDLLQEGNIGLRKAIDRFDPSLDYKFSTYATWWVRQAIRRGIDEKGYTIRIPSYLREKEQKMRKIIKNSDQELSDQELSEKLNWSIKQVRKIRSLVDTTSLEKKIGENNESKLGDVVATTQENPGRKFEDNEVSRIINETLDNLTFRKRQLIRMRFGLDSEDEATLEEVGEALNLSRERVRQLENQILERLKKRDKIKALKDIVAA